MKLMNFVSISREAGSHKLMNTRQVQFEALVNAYSTDLFRYARWLCGDASVAEDLVQETYMRAWKALHKLRDTKAAKSWLITILRREHLRRFSRKHYDTISWEDCDEAQVDTQFNGGNPLPDLAETVATNSSLQQALDALPLSHREPLLLQVLGGYSCEEIAHELGIKTNAVMTRLFRARQQLRQQLEHDFKHDTTRVG